MAYTNLDFNSESKDGPPEGVQFNQNWRLSPQTRNNMMVHSGDDIQPAPSTGNLSAKQSHNPSFT